MQKRSAIMRHAAQSRHHSNTPFSAQRAPDSKAGYPSFKSSLVHNLKQAPCYPRFGLCEMPLVRNTSKNLFYQGPGFSIEAVARRMTRPAQKMAGREVLIPTVLSRSQN